MTEPQHPFIGTPIARRALLASKVTLASQRIGFFDGPPGTGKTTTALEVAARVNRPVHVVTMPARPAPLEVLRRVIAAFKGELGAGTKAQMEDEAVAILTGWGGLLIVDEVQNIGTPGIHTLRYLHDRSACSFAMLLVGWRALETIQAHPDLESRVIAFVEFEPLTGKDLLEYVFARHPELTGTPPEVIRHLDDTSARGNLREWRNITETIAALNLPLPLTEATARQLAALKRTAA